MQTHPPLAGAAKPQIPALTGLRFFLALWVVVFHQSAADGTIMGERIPFHLPALVCLIRTGYLAVGVFFALSGFVLAYNYSLQAAWPFRRMIDFAVARFARIYPAYAVGLILMAPIVLFNVAGLPEKGWFKQTAEAGLNWTLLQAWIPTHALSWNMPGWSRSAEAFFYLCFPLAGVALWRASRKPNRILPLLLCFWMLALASPVVAIVMRIPGFSDVPATADNLHGDPFWTSLFKFNPLFHFPEFCFGILLVRFYQLIQSGNSALKGRGHLLYIPGLCLEMILISNAGSIAFPLFHNGLLLPLHGMVMLGFALGGGQLVFFLSSRVLHLLGNASYTMYILHWPVFEWMNWLSLRFYGTPPNGFAKFGLYVGILIALSILVHRFIEEPANRLIKRSWHKIRSRRFEPSTINAAAA
ncbi:MAG TPA: acyltransferase [Bryobacteraceae bacterium]|jgi:peptidoglycan/LPS O-acetylase OafA/YrhL